MARNRNTAEVEDVETEEVPETTPESSEDTPKAKAAKTPARGDLPEGYITPVGLAKVIGEKGLQKNREGEVLKEVKPQMVYSYMKNAPKDDPFPIEEVEDSLGHKRQALKVEAGVAWWERKNERTAARAANAKEKANKKAANAAKKEAAATEAEAEEQPVTEAE